MAQTYFHSISAKIAGMGNRCLRINNTQKQATTFCRLLGKDDD